MVTVEHPVDYDAGREHDFLPVAGHPDDDECTHRTDGSDATYCGRTRAEHDHHPNCYQSTGRIPDDLPADLCDCQVLRMIDDLTRVLPSGSDQVAQ